MNRSDQNNYKLTFDASYPDNLFQAHQWKDSSADVNTTAHIYPLDKGSREIAQKLTSVRNEMLYKLEATPEQTQINFETVQLGKLIEQSVESISSLVGEGEREFIYNAQDNLFVHINKDQITQCLKSVLQNAVKYTSTGGQIEINLHQVDSMAVIDITDNGSGMSAELLAELFAPGLDSDKKFKEKKLESHSDLSIVQQLIHLHGGYITAISDGLDQGSHIEISLPLVDENTDNKSTPETSLSSMRLLIVDDNIDTADSLALLLQLKGHQTVTAYSAYEAMQAVENFQADIILLDIGLPDINGYELARRLIAQGVSSKLIALTGYGQPEDIQRALDAGFSTHATKPVNVEELEYIFKKYY